MPQTLRTLYGSLFPCVILFCALALHGQSISNSDSLALQLQESQIKVKPKAERFLTVKSEFLRKIPNTMNDPMRVLSFLPGVTIQSDLNVRPFVRGGASEQTQVLVHGISLLQPYHVGGVFSVFNASTVEALDLYRENFPVEYPGALSGVVSVKSKSMSDDQTQFKTNLSLLRGDVFSEVPLIKNRLSIYGAGQAFLLNRSLHGLLDLTSKLSKDSLYQQDIQGYRDHINLPDFQDYHWGANLKARDNLNIQYSGSYSSDAYTVVIPAQTNILTSRPGSGNPNVVIPVLPKKEINRSKKLSIDSISAVGIGNQTHFISIPWDLNEKHFIENNLGYQTQNYKVAFKKGATVSADPLSLSQSTRFYNYLLSDTYNPSESHQFKFGLSYDYKQQSYDVHLPYVLYDVIINSNLDMLEGLGYFTDQGFQIEKTDSTRSNFDYLGGYPSRIRFAHQGLLKEHLGSVFFSHTWQAKSGALTYGIRGEYQNTSNEFFPAPRAGYNWHFNEDNDFLFSSGLYSQNNLPYFERDQNPKLKSEKSTQSGLQWTHRFGKGYKLQVQSYYKHYFDLVAPTLVPNGSIDINTVLLPHPQSQLSSEEISKLEAVLDTAHHFESLPDSIKQLAYPLFGDLEFNYANTGSGNSYGTEFSFYYNPTSKWRGWASLDLSLSNRKDGNGRSEYPYRYHRPLVLNWVNYFDIPGNFDISLTYRFALGQPYTPYTGTLDGTGSLAPITVGARNSGRLAPYNRLDLRLTRNSKLWKRDFKTYIEVWNSMNDPNYFARDNQTGELKSAQLNWPFPLLFLGLSYEL